MFRTVLIGAFVASLLVTSLQAENWPGWRGPRSFLLALEAAPTARWTPWSRAAAAASLGSVDVPRSG